MPIEPLRWGVLSTANIGRRAVIPALQASPTNTVLAVSSRDAEAATAFAAETGAARAYGSYAELLADDDVQAVYVPLPNALHAEWTVRAIEAGKHVLCEKPLAESAAACLRMHAAADAAGVRLMEAFMYRHHPRTRHLLDLVHGGGLGEVSWIRASFSFAVRDPANVRLNAALAGGALMDVGCYGVDVARALAGHEPTVAQADAVWASSGVDETLVGSLRFAGGLVAQIACSLAAHRTETVEVVGSEGRLTVARAFLPGTEACEIVVERDGRPPERIAFEGVDQYRLMVEGFERSVQSGETPALGQDGGRNLRAIEGLLASARDDGRRIDLGASA
jgi:D-xylose 1-dehydrogenase (NADP+, D-xylono-1,5-lactone-forming)